MNRASSILFCEACRKETRFLAIQQVISAMGISRSTVYYWMERHWIHWRELPSSRRIICSESLSRNVNREAS